MIWPLFSSMDRRHPSRHSSTPLVTYTLHKHTTHTQTRIKKHLQTHTHTESRCHRHSQQKYVISGECGKFCKISGECGAKKRNTVFLLISVNVSVIVKFTEIGSVEEY